MKYDDRRICGLMSHDNKLYRCSLDIKADKDSSCDGCALFETYLEFKSIGIDLERKKEE